MSLDFCSTGVGNTGGLKCDKKRGVPKKIVIGSKAFSSSEYADGPTLKTAILAALNLSNGDSNKLFPFPEILEIAVTTEGNTTGSLALGPIRRLRKGRPGYTFSCEIGHYQFQQLLAWDNTIVPVFTFDDKNSWWGYRAAAAANTPNTNPLKGEMALLTIQGNGFEDGANAATGVCTFDLSFQSVDDFEKRSAYQTITDLSTGDLEGLKDVMLSEPQAHASNVYKLKMTIPVPKVGGDLNIYDDYGSAIAALTHTAGSGTNYATSLPITSIAVDATLKCLTVTYDSTAFGLLGSGAKFKHTPPNVATLVAASVTGIEIGTIILTK
jgi:hypothetical protein